MAFAAVGQAAASFATGGMESPFLFAMFPIAMVGATIIEPPLLFFLVGLQAAEVWAMAWVQHSGILPHFNPIVFGGDMIQGWNRAHTLWAATFATAGLGVVTFLGRGIRYSFDGMLRRGLEAREEALCTHRERAQELAALSGEIAHELKNPLASIKGLSALLARDALPGKPTERLQVLRREVDRMQGILDEFLNFSRPLVPLAVEKIDVHALVLEVADMHEGMAHERNVRLLVKADSEFMHCDPRKIKQALINLVQNALEASPAGQAVEIEALEGPEIGLRVLDRGPGVAANLHDKIFEPGVTTKAHGSGLGLTIARALVRQHGGELTLSSRDGGGAVAFLRLPKEIRP
jgi:signal transduction histidine kinase